MNDPKKMNENPVSNTGSGDKTNVSGNTGESISPETQKDSDRVQGVQKAEDEKQKKTDTEKKTPDETGNNSIVEEKSLADSNVINTTSFPDFFPGSDTTSLHDVHSEIKKDQGKALGKKELYTEANDYVGARIPTEKVQYENKISSGLDLLKRYEFQSNRAWHVYQGTFVIYAIQKGKILNILKEVVKKNEKEKSKDERIGWSNWANENIKFLEERSRRNYMLLAEREDCHPYFYLGSERLLHLIGATKGEENDTVSDFLKKHELEFDPRSNPEDNPQLVKQFKDKVDAALAVEKGNEKYGLELDLLKTQGLIALKFKIDNRFFENLKLIKDTGGNLDEHLERIKADIEEYGPSGKPTSVKESFDKLASRLKSRISEIIDDANLLRGIDKELLRSLVETLNQLKEETEKY